MTLEDSAKTVGRASRQSTLARVAGAAKETLAGLVTLLSLAGFSAFVIYLLMEIGAKEPAWSRRTYLFAAVEAITFAAVGWLFGKEVHRERAGAAEKRAGTAEAKAGVQAEEAVKFRERGFALRHAIVAATQGHRELAPHLRQGLGAAAEPVVNGAGVPVDQLARQ